MLPLLPLFSWVVFCLCVCFLEEIPGYETLESAKKLTLGKTSQAEAGYIEKIPSKTALSNLVLA